MLEKTLKFPKNKRQNQNQVERIRLQEVRNKDDAEIKVGQEKWRNYLVQMPKLAYRFHTLPLVVVKSAKG
jgi:hypothetical protein